MDFLKGPWHRYISNILSIRDSYDEEHIPQIRDLGIFLEPSEFDEIPEFFCLLGNQIDELDSEDSFFEDEMTTMNMKMMTSMMTRTRMKMRMMDVMVKRRKASQIPQHDAPPPNM